MTDPSVVARLAALAVLGLPEQASARDITQAYRRLAKTTHPDLYEQRVESDLPHPATHDAGHRFAELTDAYRTLTAGSAAPVEEGAGDQTSPGVTPPPRSRPTPVTVRYSRPPTRPPIIAGPVHITPFPPSTPEPPTSRRPR
jgi:hypothetical protein